jgi:hypothetical protein
MFYPVFFPRQNQHIEIMLTLRQRDPHDFLRRMAPSTVAAS